jgi:hypothetical protein
VPLSVQADQCLKSWSKNDVADGQTAFTNIAAALDDNIIDITGLESLQITLQNTLMEGASEALKRT